MTVERQCPRFDTAGLGLAIHVFPAPTPGHDEKPQKTVDGAHKAGHGAANQCGHP
jgi:hypothetical protein